jgi:hypothetical protein
MSEVSEFFRHCPSCGRRFHIKLVSKTLVDDRKEVTEVKQAMISPTSMGYRSMPSVPLIVEENIPITIEIEDFQLTYKCKHCGHVWSETRVEQSKA